MIVVLLHGVVIWGFVSQFGPRRILSPPVTVHVSLVRETVVQPKLPPPPLPHFAPQAVSLPSIPRFSVIPLREPPAPAAPPARFGPPQPAEPPAQAALPPPDYLKRLLAYLNAYKNYPSEARLHHEQGTVRLRFTMDRRGHVLSYEVTGSSGSATLDEEARAMIRRAQPLPPPPPDYPGETFDLIVPVNFSLH